MPCSLRVIGALLLTVTSYSFLLLAPWDRIYPPEIVQERDLFMGLTRSKLYPTTRDVPLSPSGPIATNEDGPLATTDRTTPSTHSEKKDESMIDVSGSNVLEQTDIGIVSPISDNAETAVTSLKETKLSYLDMLLRVQKATKEDFPRLETLLKHYDDGEIIDEDAYVQARPWKRSSREALWIDWVTNDTDDVPLSFRSISNRTDAVRHAGWPPPSFNPSRFSSPRKSGVYICTIIRNEQDHLPEWLDYYFDLGVEGVWIYDHGSTDSTLDIVRAHSPFVRHVNYTEQRFIPSKHSYKDASVIHCVTRLRDMSPPGKWVGIIDLDEFVTIADPTLKIDEYLDGVAAQRPDVGGVTLHFKYFDGSGRFRADEGVHSPEHAHSMVCGFRRQCHAPVTQVAKLYTNSPYKTFIRPLLWRKWQSHHRAHYIANFTNVNNDLSSFETYKEQWNRMAKNPKSLHVGAWLNHYFMGSFHDYLKKLNRRVRDDGSWHGGKLFVKQFFSFHKQCLPAEGQDVEEDVLFDRRCRTQKKETKRQLALRGT